MLVLSTGDRFAYYPRPLSYLVPSTFVAHIMSIVLFTFVFLEVLVPSLAAAFWLA